VKRVNKKHSATNSETELPRTIEKMGNLGDKGEKVPLAGDRKKIERRGVKFECNKYVGGATARREVHKTNRETQQKRLGSWKCHKVKEIPVRGGGFRTGITLRRKNLDGRWHSFAIGM